MDKETIDSIERRLYDVESAYRGAAEEELHRGYGGSIDTIHDLVKEARSFSRKAYYLRRRWGQ